MEYSYRNYKKFCEENGLEVERVVNILIFKNFIINKNKVDEDRILSYINFHLKRLEILEKERVEING